ncbi:proline utilisation trans-activator, putative [Candida dubliniensis CD36]|uniref:Proline utilisation trans-activator, putative n=1 Tax=Candida dubliniensis (strain CD36 / ATCC MYA-646 / CBS 7987 / NCPF 3949 / NRRL Y-17841) TaxID=573826 RepID=B9W893_CANDC|nr:proline utilisation trans-activator, putative [Candida dubliniensis CD36]CAX44948.1 proline utilisation trans-activator, putative [Candida dubliniensis CD36]
MDPQDLSEEKNIADALINLDTIPLDLQPPASSSASSPMTSTRSKLETPKSVDTNTSLNPRQKRASLACIRCRTRHIRCPGGDPCRKCQLAKSKCEYVEADKKIVVSMKYLSKLHDEIARLKKDNAGLRNNLKEQELKQIDSPQGKPQFANASSINRVPPLSMGPNIMGTLQSQTSQTIPSSFVQPPPANGEVIHPSLDKYGRLIQSRTGEKVYVGSSSMTLFGLEIQNMVPSFVSSSLLSNTSSSTTPAPSPNSSDQTLPPLPTQQQHQLPNSLSPKQEHYQSKRESKILEKEGNAYKITLSKTKTRPGLSINFELPSYSYAMLLVDTFINYNDGCFYFFNEGLIKRFLMNLYSGKAAENKRILRRNTHPTKSPDQDENTIKKDTDDETILETIWFCKILLIFAIGEMYLGTESSTHARRQKLENMKRSKEKREKHALPGSAFFYQASELFTGLFASGAIDNITKDGGIEVMLLYAFYLQVADCTIASYFYFGLALRAALILGWHVDADKENLNRFELEHRRRIWWTVYMYERMLSSKAGLPLSFADDSVSTELPIDFKIDLTDFPRDELDVRGYYIFPPADYINNCVTITQINAVILSSLYTKQPSFNILPVVTDLVQRLMAWKTSLPKYLDVDYSVDSPKVSRLVTNLMTEYFQGINLAVRPLLFHFATKKLKELQIQNTQNKYIDLTKYSKNVLTLLNASFQASINTIKSIWSLLQDNMVALFGWMDREYLFTSASTLILFNASFGVHEATRDHLDHALILFTKMKRLGNYPAALRRAQLLKLINVLDFNGVMAELLEKHDDDNNSSGSSSKTMSASATESTTDNNVGPFLNPPPIRPSDLDFLQFTNVQGNEGTDGMDGVSNAGVGVGVGTGDVYANQDLTGIEGLTYLDAEQKLWSDITNEAGWLNMHSTEKDTNVTERDPLDEGFIFNTLSPDLGSSVHSGYSNLINHEFQDFMDQS